MDHRWHSLCVKLTGDRGLSYRHRRLSPVSAGEPYVMGCKSRDAMDVHATPPTGPRRARDRAYDRLNPNTPFPAPGGEGNDLLRTLIVRDPDGLLVVGRSNNIIHFANPAAAALLGRPGVDLRG